MDGIDFHALPTLNLAVKAGFDTPLVKPVLEKLKKIVAYYKHSSIAYQILKDTATKLKDDSPEIGNCKTLVQEVPTRWHSIYEMINRDLHLKAPLLAITNNDNLIPTTNQWKAMEELEKILEPIKLTMDHLGGETYAFVYPTVMNRLAELQEKDTDSLMVAAFKATMLKNTNDLFTDEVQRDLMEVCCFLDPR